MNRTKNDTLLSKENTLWLQGVSALLIMLLHFMMQMDGYPRVANIPAGSCVTVFLLLSGFGLNESYRQNGLAHYWEKRLKRVVIPFWIVSLAQLPFGETTCIGTLLRQFLFCGSNLWFLDYLMRWYLIFWIGRKVQELIRDKWYTRRLNFLAGNLTACVLFGAALYSLSLPQLMSEQSFSFFMGFLISEHYRVLKQCSHRSLSILTISCLAYSILCLSIKGTPAMQSQKGTFPFHLLLLNIRLSQAIAMLPLPFLFPFLKNRATSFLGKISYEIYLVHYNFMSCIASRWANLILYSVSSLVISAVFSRFNEWMKQRKAFIYAMAALAYCCIAYLFATKYVMRVTDHYGFVTITYLTFTVGVLMFLLKSPRKEVDSLLASKRTFWICLSLFALLMLIVQYHFDPLQNKVDRWSALAYPIRNLLHGEFPYLAKTHLGGYASPFPVWQLFHIPFYLLGNVGLSEIVTSLLFIWSVKYRYGIREALLSLAILGLSLNFWYEVSVRSDLISNFMLLATLINIMRRRGTDFSAHPLVLSAMSGLWLSTRITTAFPLYLLFLPAWFTLPWHKKLMAPATALCAFALTFLPLVLWDADTLFHHEYNPFVLQSRQGNPGDSWVLLIIVTAMALKSKTETHYYFFSALILILVPVIAYGHHMIEAGQLLNIFEPWCDITYLDAAIPFLIMTMMSTIHLQSTSQTLS